jgi:hypothetical protein
MRSTAVEIVRVDVPWTSGMLAGEHHDTDFARYGEQREWGHAVPQMFRILAAPKVRHEFVALTSDSVLAYWGALLHMLTFSFGWSDLGRGLSAWYFGRRETDDPRFELLQNIWVADGHIEELLALLLRDSFGAGYATGPMHELSRLGGFTPKHSSIDALAHAPEAFVDSVMRRVEERPRSDIPDPLRGGSDPLHLGAHLRVPVSDTSDTPQGEPGVILDRGSGRAAVLLDSMDGWYRRLSEVGASLPERSAGSWYLDVHVRTVGFLGTYRRSRVSGLWFSGRHRYHVWGIAAGE